MNRFHCFVLAFVALVLSTEAHAHFPTLSCQIAEGAAEQLSCVAGYSDGSLASEEVLKVYSYEEALILTVKTATDGSVVLKKPKGEFYIVFDPGHESPAEFDYAEL